ncbi:MFS transporter [Microbacterium sp. EYE_5]|uniref:MFS transporter n=1 Tax=unclassified Microbacterium TaxID=2609290 RepID=UPI0020069679|nr:MULTISPECIES: MFS transporter [unclassified Microbacterium]MCK6079394.1 MFS transporter [Microbacterium sp. EYE_382]MCK6084664.1 MFS transporter [Microbacterium sp. EYE_384]MCK6123107.1 MFS transporter [Microbacterium sp. EYE_80]MCK6125428.1 MFS transporter [Microbacterium sp. EYE_79]MCK6140348.1 MFS transporter [Microbacterium sp. EYE_39]
MGLRNLFVTLPLAILSFSIFWGGVQGVLLPIQVQNIDRDGQNEALALIIGMGAIASMIAAPIAGALTDRTRTRLGGRAPWMIFGAVSTFALALALAFATSITMMAVIIVAIQFTTSLILTPVSAYIPDRVPAVKRGMFSAAFGLAQLVGNVVGQSVGAAFSTTLIVGYLVLGGILAALVLLFALTNVRSNTGEPKPPLNLVSLLQTFWVNPIEYPNFAWTFFGRFLLFTGYFPLWTFMLYLLQDFIGLGEDAVGAIPTMGSANLVGSVLGTLAAGYAVQKLKRTKPVIFAASVIIIIALAVPLFAPSLTSMLVYSALAGFGMGAFISVDFVLITLVLPDAENTGKDLGIINVTTTLPQTIGVTIGSLAIGAFGSYAALLPFGIIATALGALLLFFIRGVK